VTGLVLAGGLGYAAWWAAFERHVEATDNVYVQAPVVQITAQAPGTVVSVLADDTQQVSAGQVLVRLDAADARLALDRAEAQLAQTVREVRALFVGQATYASSVEVRQAELARARAELLRLSDDAARRAPLVAGGAVSAEEAAHAQAAMQGGRTAVAAAEAALAVARDQAGTQRVLVEGTTVAGHPSVERAAGAVREAFLALRRCEIATPASGTVARRAIQVGQRIAAGAPLMTVIPLEQAWVEANFKESQLARMRLGQPVELHADVYGSRVTYRGQVAGLAAGTGAAFALLPTQNATGNWVKVVQRVPVRIAVAPEDLARHPLRVGLSMQARVDVESQGGAPLAQAGGTAQAGPGSPETDPALAEADRRVRAIVAAHGGAAAATGGRKAAR
jgi:membrane fusion protein (multidrug efflux system)